MNDTKHLWRLFLLVVIGVTAVIVGRLFFVPKTFGMFGPYRAANLLEQRAFPVKYQGPGACEPCHADEYAFWKANGHKTIICEDCHAPITTHIKGDEKFADMEINRSFNFCLRCHQKLPARPEKFPQIDPIEHLADAKLSLQDTVCLVCHSPHDPTPKDPNAATTATPDKKEKKAP